MAYMSQEMKKQLAPQIKAVLKKYGMKGSIAVDNYSVLVVNVKSGKLDILKNYVEKASPQYEVKGSMSVNPFYIADLYSAESKDFLLELKDAMNSCEEIQNHDNNDYMTDYFDVGWYININIGQWDKPFQLTA